MDRAGVFSHAPQAPGLTGGVSDVHMPEALAACPSTRAAVSAPLGVPGPVVDLNSQVLWMQPTRGIRKDRCAGSALGETRGRDLQCTLLRGAATDWPRAPLPSGAWTRCPPHHKRGRGRGRCLSSSRGNASHFKVCKPAGPGQRGRKRRPSRGLLSTWIA